MDALITENEELQKINKELRQQLNSLAESKKNTMKIIKIL
jgi:cell division septum initiation protein DivIVA